MRFIVLLMFLLSPLHGLTIKVDYRLDTNGFFDNPQARAVIEAAAARWSRVIDQKLKPVNITGSTQWDRRFLLGRHPGTGQQAYTFSTAASAASDYMVQVNRQEPADVYLDGFTLKEDEWILFVGGRPLGEIGIAVGSPLFGGANANSVFEASDGFLNRGFNKGMFSLGVLGGVVSFNEDTTWSFDLSNPRTLDSTDFYTIALHEIGHGLGLSASRVEDWSDLVVDGGFIGENAVRAFNEDNDASVTMLEIHGDELHWGNNFHTSKIFPYGSPNYHGTVDPGQLQELLLEPKIDLNGPVYRAEITNVDIGALKDIGWSVITEDPPRPPELSLGYTALESGGLALDFPSERGATYIVQTSLEGSAWRNVTPFLEGTGTTLTWEDGQEGFTDPYGPAAGLDGKFYRVIQQSALDAEAPDPGQ